MFYYVIEIEDREFPVVILPDGMSQWDDHNRLKYRYCRSKFHIIFLQTVPLLKILINTERIRPTP